MTTECELKGSRRKPTFLTRGVRQRIRVLLASGAVFIAMVWLPDTTQIEFRAFAPNLPEMEISAPELPAMEARVFRQTLPFYHWRQDCPLAAAAKNPQRVSMSRREAERRNMDPCVFCPEEL